MEFPDLLDRFLRYVKIDTQSDEASATFPSTQKQFDLLSVLKTELLELGLTDVILNEDGYILATLPGNQTYPCPTIGLIAHVDTSPDVSGKDVNPQIHPNYDGNNLILSQKDNIILDTGLFPLIKTKKGKTIITGNGNTLLGADDKAGIAEIMSAVHYLIEHPDIPRPAIRIIFTPDEEVGRGTEKLKKEDLKADFAYTIDGTDLGEIEDETFCADSVDIIVHGINVHPGYAKDKMINSIKIAAEIISQFPENGLSPETTENREGYIHPHLFNGSVEKTQIKILIRDFTENGLVEKENFIKHIVDQVQIKYPTISIEFSVSESYRNMKKVLSQYPEVINKAIKAIELSGIEPKRNVIRGGTDGAKLCFMGLPTPNLFTGGANFHSKYEWIALEDMQKATEVIVQLMKLWAAK